MLCEMPCLPAEKGYGTARRAAYVVVDGDEKTGVCEPCAAEMLIDVALQNVPDFREVHALPWLTKETAPEPDPVTDLFGNCFECCPECGAIVLVDLFGLGYTPENLAEKQRYHNIVEHGREA